METNLAATLVPRVLGTLRLDLPTLEDVERDERAGIQAAVVVLLVGVANGVGVAQTEDIGNLGLLTGPAGNILGWLVFAGVAYVVGTGLLPGEGTEVESSPGGVVRTVGFAQAPNILGIAVVVGAFGQLLAAAGLAWSLICGIAALRVALRVTLGRAIPIRIIAGAATLVAASLFVALVDATLV